MNAVEANAQATILRDLTAALGITTPDGQPATLGQVIAAINQLKAPGNEERKRMRDAHEIQLLRAELANARREMTGVLAEVAAERKRQDAKWGQQNHPDGTGTFVHWAGFGGHAAHVAIAAREQCQQMFAQGQGTWRHVLLEEIAEAFATSHPDMLRGELIQVAAVCVAWIEAIDRRAHGGDQP